MTTTYNGVYQTVKGSRAGLLDNIVEVNKLIRKELKRLGLRANIVKTGESFADVTIKISDCDLKSFDDFYDDVWVKWECEHNRLRNEVVEFREENRINSYYEAFKGFYKENLQNATYKEHYIKAFVKTEILKKIEEAKDYINSFRDETTDSYTDYFDYRMSHNITFERI